MPTYGAALLINYDIFIAREMVWMVLFFVFFFSCLLPILNILFLYWRKAISSLQLYDRKERTLPYLSTLMVYGISYYMIKDQLPAPGLTYSMLGGTIAILVTAIANRFYKVSAHMIGIGGLTGAVLFISVVLGYNTTTELIILFPIAGILGAARLALNAHSPFEIWTGYVMGFAVQAVFLFL